MSRRDAREKAFMLLYQLEIQKGGEEDQIAAFIADRDVSQAEVEYMTQLVQGVREKAAELDALFTPFLKRWTKERLPKIDLAILRLAVFEMFHVPDVPRNVAISEAVLLCKKYSSEESRSYVNAVLGRLGSLAAETDPEPAFRKGGADDPARAGEHE
jgi:transcription antitermination protein NusB